MNRGAKNGRRRKAREWRVRPGSTVSILWRLPWPTPSLRLKAGRQGYVAGEPCFELVRAATDSIIPDCVLFHHLRSPRRHTEFWTITRTQPLASLAIDLEKLWKDANRRGFTEVLEHDRPRFLIQYTCRLLSSLSADTVRRRKTPGMSLVYTHFVPYQNVQPWDRG